MPKSGNVGPAGSGVGTSGPAYRKVVSFSSSGLAVLGSDSGFSQLQSGSVQSQGGFSGQLHVGGQFGLEQSHSSFSVVATTEA